MTALARRPKAALAIASLCAVAALLACGGSGHAQVKLTPARPGATQAPNPAGLTLEISPGPEVKIGQNVWFKASAAKPGYLVLIDVDPSGKLTQIYPNLDSMRIPIGGDGESNRIRPGRPVTVPDPTSPIANFEFVVDPPAGPGLVVGLLSPHPVQHVDLPEAPVAALGTPEAIDFIFKAAQSLRIVTDRGMIDPQWSLAATPYAIK
jgi:hypothetical protein